MPLDRKPPDSLETAWYVSPGVEVGVAAGRSAKTSAVLGAEVSFVRFPIHERTWVGGYVDAIRDYGSERTLLSIGPELGWGILGIDLGPRLSIGERTRVGWTIRPMLSFVYAHLYTRVTRVDGSTATEIGLLVKLPTRL